MQSRKSVRFFPRLAPVFVLAVVAACDVQLTGTGEPPDEVRLSTALDSHVPVTLIGAGDIAECSGDADEATAQLLDAELLANPAATVFTLGDNVYPTGSAADFNDCYDPTWGRHLAATRAALGDEEYETAGAQGAFDYFGAANLGGAGKGYYSYDAGDWHIIVLNDQIDVGPESVQLDWLRADLAASPAMCTAAIFHEPRFHSYNGGDGVGDTRRPIWQELYKAGVEVILNGHRHLYERYAPQNFQQVPDPTHGVRQFIVGTGGRSHYNPINIQINSEVQEFNTYGVLKLVLDAGSYSWEFVPEAGETFTDVGAETCHGPPPPPPETISLTTTLRPDNRVTLNWSGATGSRVDIWRNGINTRNTTNDGGNTDTPPGPGTYSYQICNQDWSACSPESTVVIGGNQPPTAHPGGPYTGDINVAVQFDGSGSSDPEQGPLTYAWDFGDGNTSTLENPTHAYAATGQFTVTLVVTDQEAEPSTPVQTTADITDPNANQPPTADPGGPYTGDINVAVQFDGSGSSDPEQGPLTYAWDFGDGNTSTLENPTHAYAATGQFTVTLVVTDQEAEPSTPVQTTADITDPNANQPPTADPGGPYTGDINVAVQFDGSGSSDPEQGPLTYAWDFGDGNTSTLENPTHAYAATGQFTVTLVVTDQEAEPSTPVQTTADITDPNANQPPTADPGGPYTGDINVAVQFDGSGSSDPEQGPLTYAWDFGDGNTSTLENPTHAYAATGQFTVTLVVTDQEAEPSAPVQTTADITDPNVTITLTTRILGGSGRVRLDWSGANGARVDIERDGQIVASTTNDGATTNTPPSPTGSYTYRICEQATSDCSNFSTAVFGGSPPTANAGGPYSGDVGVNINFDGTGSTDPGGSIVQYDWNFGDGNTGSGATPTHAYAAPGNYNVTLTVTDNDGETDADGSTAAVAGPNQPPTADPGGPYSGQVGQSVQFDGTGSSDPEQGPLTYAWDFGDGNTGTGATPTHTYSTMGNYTVSLVVTDDQNQPSPGASTTADITDDPPPNQAPTANAGGPYNGQPGASVQFDGSGSFDPEQGPLTYAWDFGDGNTGSGVAPTHTYASAGSYTVTLVVTDDQNEPSQPDVTSADIQAGSSITLETRLLADGRVRLDWSGAAGARVDIERDGIITRSTTNDGATTDTAPSGSHTYRICEQGTGTCSNSSTIVVP